MRILFISNLYPNPHSPNAATFSRQQITALRNIAHVDVIAPIPWPVRLRVSIPYSYTDLDMEVHHPTYFYTPKILRGLYGQFYLASIRSIAEKLLATRNYDCIYSSWLFPDGWAAAQLASKFAIPLFVNVVGTDVNRLKMGSSVTEKALWVVDRAQRVIAVSNNLKKTLIKFGADPQKIEVVYNGVNRSIFRPMDRNKTRINLDIPIGRTVVLFVGNLKKEKGVFELTEAFAQLVKHRTDLDLELALVGSGPCEQKLRSFLKRNGGLNRVRFVGSIPLEEVAQWMNACDVFCLPSYMEGQPNVVIEALACQTRVVATNVGGIPELDSGQGAIQLVNPKSVKELTVAIEGMLLRERCSTVHNSICTWQENVQRLLKIFCLPGSIEVGNATNSRH